MRIFIVLILLLIGCQSTPKPLDSVIEETKEARKEFIANPTKQNQKRFIKAVENLEKSSSDVADLNLEQAEEIDDLKEKVDRYWEAAKKWYLLIGTIILSIIGFIAFKVLRFLGKI
jgi:hypothetical protein